MEISRIFTGTDILLPPFAGDPEAMERWAVIACDQFTSDAAYWNTVERFCDGYPSTYDYILPEAFLGTPKESEKACDVLKHMRDVPSSDLWRAAQRICGYIYVERTLPDGRVRRGICGAVDLEEYDYSAGSKSMIRATEETVASRIPPRCRMRRDATLELPHIMLFAQDRSGIFDTASELCGDLLYDFDLMQGGGHIRGRAIEGDAARRLSGVIADTEHSCDIPYAVGDGNHSLAAAKAHYDALRAHDAAAAETHPARYAMCELVSIYDDAIEFEPIYRVLTGVDCDELLHELESVSGGDGEQSFCVVSADGRRDMSFKKKTHPMTVGTLQDFIDRYISEHDGVSCDYIHGETDLISLASRPGTAGFLFGGFERGRLFDLICDGPLPRKTFSMGDAHSKRYYLEARSIVK